MIGDSVKLPADVSPVEPCLLEVTNVEYRVTAGPRTARASEDQRFLSLPDHLVTMLDLDAIDR